MTDVDGVECCDSNLAILGVGAFECDSTNRVECDSNLSIPVLGVDAVECDSTVSSATEPTTVRAIGYTSSSRDSSLDFVA